MVYISDQETEDSSGAGTTNFGTPYRQSVREGCSLTARLAGEMNPLADFAFDKLPTELLVEIFKHAHPDVGAGDSYRKELLYPVALSQVCHHWRTVAVGAPTLWTNIRIVDYHMERTKGVACTYKERSKSCPLFLTWFSCYQQGDSDVQVVINDLIIPLADRWQRITLITTEETVPEALLPVMGLLDFPILQDVELYPSSARSELALCRNAPLLRRYKLENASPLPPLPSNLVVFDSGGESINLDTLLEFLSHVSHSLEHLRSGPGSSVSLPHRIPKIPLQNLKSLILRGSHTIMDSILVPNLIYLSVLHPLNAEAQKVAEMFNGFSAPGLKSLRFYRTPLDPLLTSHNVPSMFPQLESVAFINCVGESALVTLLEPPQLKKPSSLPEGSKRRKVDNPLPMLKEITVSDMRNWTTLQVAIEKRLKNSKSLRKILLPKKEVPDTILRHLTQWLPKQGIELHLYETDASQLLAPPEFEDDLFNRDYHFFSDIMAEMEWDDDEDDGYFDDGDPEYWEEGFMDHHLGYYNGQELPHDWFSDEHFDDEEDDDDDEDMDDFHEG